ncbi:hypothetical protein [Solirubrobacter soli]|uniref:hypothetical protein n=1 Tax=Solirubrobacter soli TaxID=363832 RepID=UPI00041466E0|nr:hypothetical protein [Solirubrobacter soli]
MLEHRAQLGSVGSYTLNNTTKESLRVTVTVRPWRQQLDGTVISDPRANLTRYVRATTQTFTLSAGAKRPVSFRMVRRPSGGSLYASVEAFGKPTNTKGRKGIIPQYKIVSSLRLNPSRKSYRLKTGAAQVRGGSLILPVRNLGNSIDPVSGTYTLSGAGSRNGSIAGVKVIPGKLVGLSLGAVRGLKKGRYTVSASLVQGSKRVTARTSVTVR